jgi:hypothetical protein
VNFSTLRGDDAGGSKRLPTERHARERIKSHRVLDVGNVEIAHARCRLLGKASKIASARSPRGSSTATPSPALNVVHGEVEQDCRLAGTGLTDNIDMPLALSCGEMLSGRCRRRGAGEDGSFGLHNPRQPLVRSPPIQAACRPTTRDLPAWSSLVLRGVSELPWPTGQPVEGHCRRGTHLNPSPASTSVYGAPLASRRMDWAAGLRPCAQLLELRAVDHQRCGPCSLGPGRAAVVRIRRKAVAECRAGHPPRKMRRQNWPLGDRPPKCARRGPIRDTETDFNRANTHISRAFQALPRKLWRRLDWLAGAGGLKSAHLVLVILSSLR